ncbi:amidohydrolase family protein [Nonomuraea sp. NPDC050790]|uniref:amidohydrolase family protein n=1 Tax=Nonomuraea sp. NPDC050790 TaxID=3364371 RepID=UPI00379C2C0D
MADIVDVHTHLYPPLYLDALGERTENPRVAGRTGDDGLFMIFPGDAGRPVTDAYWSLDTKVAFMDRHGITTSVVSLGNPWLDPFEAGHSTDLARKLNEEFASFEGRTGGRVLGMGCLPNAPVETVTEVIAEIAARPSLYGVVSGTRLAGKVFDDPELEPVWAALETHGVPLLVHPHYGVGVEEMSGYGHSLPLALSFPFETSLALSKLAMCGALARHPGLRIIASHGGGTLPFLAGRLDGCWRPDPAALIRHDAPPSASLAKLYFDALVYNPRALRATADLAGTDKMVFGTDHPFEIADPATNLAAIDQVFPDAADRDRVLGANARTLFGRP